MFAVSDTTPLRYLVAIGQQDLLARLFGRVVAPQAVHDELQGSGTPQVVRTWADQLPEWVTIQEARGDIPFPRELHRGEREAILLALELRPPFLLIDDRAGRQHALGLGLPVLGTLGILEQADRAGWIDDFPATLNALRASGFFIAASLYQLLLDRHKERTKALGQS